MEFQAPERIGRYRIERALGQGGMGSVWEASDEAGTRVALKFLKGSSRRPEDALRLAREARVSERLRHPALVDVLEVVEFDGKPVLVMELLSGETLRTRLGREPKLSLATTAALLLPVVEAVALAHTAGIVHRDLKPENLFLPAGPRATTRVLDFGIAKFMESGGHESENPLTAIGTLLGTPPYMAPEQALGLPDVDERADVWACGVILYELLCGFRPLEAEEKPEAIRQLLLSGITPIEAAEPELPRDFAALVGRMLTRQPEKREPNLNALVAALGAYAAGR